MERNNKKLKALVFYIFLILSAVLMVEIFLTALDMSHKRVETVFRNKGMVTRVEDPVLFYWNSPNYERTDYPQNNLYVHDRNGFRVGNNISQKKEDGTFRIIILGDSVAYGEEVNQSDIFPTLLEGMLNFEKPNKSQRYEVVNAGVPGYNTLQEYTWLKDFGMDFDPDMVIVAYDYTDIWLSSDSQDKDNIYYNVVDVQPIPIYLPLPFGMTELFARSSKIYQYSNLGIYKLAKNFAQPAFFYDRSIETAKSSIADMKGLTQASNISLAFLVLPSFYEDQPVQDYLIRTELEKLNVSIITLYKEYSDAGHDRLKVFEYDNIHPNKIGHKIIADKLFEWIASNEKA